MSLLFTPGGGTSASGNDAESPRVTPGREASPPAPLLAALRLLGEGRGAAGREAFDRIQASEASPAWRAVALLGRGLCEQMGGAGVAAQVSIQTALEEWSAADPGACALALAALGRALAGGLDVERGEALMASAERLAGGGPPELLAALLLELGSAAAESGAAQTAAERWERAWDRGDAATRAAAAANLGRLAVARGDAAPAGQMFEIALAVADGPHLRVVADGLVALASQAAAEGHWEEVDARLRQALPLRQADGDGHGVAEILHDLGIAHWRRGQVHGATRCLEDCRASAEDLGDEVLRCAALRALAAVALEGGRLVVALAYAQEAAVSARGPDDRREVAAVLRQVGDEARRRGSASLGGEAFRTAARILAG